MEKCAKAGQTIDDNIIRNMRFAFWMTKATETHSEYVMLIAFLLQYWLYERSSMLPLLMDKICSVQNVLNVWDVDLKPSSEVSNLLKGGNYYLL